MSYDDALWMYGNDKPDIRFGMKLLNLKKPEHVLAEKQDSSTLINGAGFNVFDNAETVIALAVPGAAEYTRKQMDELTEWVKRPQIGMQGLVNIRYNADGSLKSSVDKFFGADRLKTIAEAVEAQPGDLILVLAGKEELTRKAASTLRLEMGERLGLRKTDEFKLLWVLDFPLFEFAHEDVDGGGAGRWVARHHPFTSPRPADIELMVNNSPKVDDLEKYLEHPYARIKANAYDMVLNGNEIGGGSIRIFQRELQEKMFAALGMSDEEAKEKFGFLLGAFEYGAPPHGGIAFGFDRLCSILGGSESIRDFIAFPKNNAGRDVMLDAPGEIDEKQYKELNIKSTLAH
jgi:aspartyl-tRNA synthetase